jgi:hypothetical protein
MTSAHARVFDTNLVMKADGMIPIGWGSVQEWGHAEEPDAEGSEWQRMQQV